MTLIEEYADALEPIVFKGDKCIEEYADFVTSDELFVGRKMFFKKSSDAWEDGVFNFSN